MRIRKTIKIFLSESYYGFRKVLETHIFGTKLQEWVWKNKGFFCGFKNIKSRFIDSVNAVNYPHRIFLVSKILSYLPIGSVLEVGCETGLNLCLLASKNPDIKLYGVDINRKSIEKGKNIIKDMAGINVFLSHGMADSLETFGDKSIDVVLTDSLLMYIGPDKIYKVINELKRVARKAIILVEWHGKSPNGIEYIHGHWVYDYQSLLSRYYPPESIRMTKITKELWDNNEWNNWGYIIELNVERLQ
jgi:ubiquinone/menaquinone biosynthesis C-methylase UbiE